MTLRRVARPRLLDSHCLLENSRGCVREIALFPILLFFRFALRFGHVESCHRSTLREILKFKLTHYPFFDIGHSLTGRIQNANLARSKARPVLPIIDRLIFLRGSEIPSNLT